MQSRATPHLAADPDDHALPPPSRGTPITLLALLAVALAAGAAWWWSRSERAPAPAPVSAVAPAPTAPAQPQPAIRHPLEQEVAPALATASDVEAALRALLGADAVLRFLQLGDFPRRVVATVDSLGREHAPVTMWPVPPSAGRFTVEGAEGEQRMAAANARRYQPLVAVVAALDAHQAAALYRRMYPLLQSEYRALGFGDRYFNDRAVEVIDLLLATPEPASPPQLRLVEVKGPIPSERPWTRYEFSDPALQSLAAGQKVLLRMSPEQRALLKTKLRELRADIATRP
jgi:hypothetical protein